MSAHSLLVLEELFPVSAAFDRQHPQLWRMFAEISIRLWRDGFTNGLDGKTVFGLMRASSRAVRIANRHAAYYARKFLLTFPGVRAFEVKVTTNEAAWGARS